MPLRSEEARVAARLDQARKLARAADDTTRTLREQLRNNHFAEIIGAALGERR